MSATLSPDPIARLLAEGTDRERMPVVESDGRIFPVETRYRASDPQRRLDENIAGAIRSVVAEETEGDLLVFLPGRFEIMRTAEHLADYDVLPLHGRLSSSDQDRALRPRSASAAARRIILATAIAESSVTIDGVRIVVDAGFTRLPRFDPSSGMTRLETIRAPLSSVDQRRGRAGRLGPGICYRLWNPAEEQGFRLDATPEIREADLLPLILEILGWGVSSDDLRWLDPPPLGPAEAALSLGRDLGLVSEEGGLTDNGRAALAIPLHPRLAAMLLGSNAADLAQVATLAALVEEGDPMRGGMQRGSPDIRIRLDLLRRRSEGGVGGGRVDRGAVSRILREAKRITSLMKGQSSKEKGSSRNEKQSEALSVGALLARAYPDRIATMREGSDREYRMSNGQTVLIEEPGALLHATFLVIPSILPSARHPHVLLAAPIEPGEIAQLFADRIAEVIDVDFDHDSGRVAVAVERRLGALLLERRRVENPDEEMIVAATIAGVRRQGLRILPWTKKATALRQRLAFLHTVFADDTEDDAIWPDVSDDALLSDAESWLAPALRAGRGRNRLASLDLVTTFRSMLDWRAQSALERLAPERVRVPSGPNIRIDYTDPSEPVLPVRLQQMFGATTTPRIADERVTLTLHLLSPAGRPVQVTRDLAGFWQRTYAEVRKELRGRYPKHAWPENPFEGGKRRD